MADRQMTDRQMTDCLRGFAMSYNPKFRDELTDKLFEAVLSLETMEECYRFFEDLATIGEIKALAQRLEIAKLLDRDLTYDNIVRLTGASTVSISRVKKALQYGAGGLRLVLDRVPSTPAEAETATPEPDSA